MIGVLTYTVKGQDMDIVLTTWCCIHSPSKVAEDFLGANYLHRKLVVVVTQKASIFTVFAEDVLRDVCGVELSETPNANESFFDSYSSIGDPLV